MGYLGLFAAAFGAATLLPLQSEAVLVGLLLSALGMIVGSLLPQVTGVRPQSASLESDAQRA